MEVYIYIYKIKTYIDLKLLVFHTNTNLLITSIRYTYVHTFHKHFKKLEFQIPNNPIIEIVVLYNKMSLSVDENKKFKIYVVAFICNST